MLLRKTKSILTEQCETSLHMLRLTFKHKRLIPAYMIIEVICNLTDFSTFVKRITS